MVPPALRLESFVDWLLDQGLSTVAGIANDREQSGLRDPVQSYLNAVGETSVSVNLPFHSIGSHDSCTRAPAWCRERWDQYTDLADNRPLTARDVLKLLAATESGQAKYRQPRPADTGPAFRTREE
jgi:hypothetical protein